MKTASIRKIVKIDEDKCDGCGVCVPKCAEGAIKLVNGKAKLVADNLCDGLGNCLGECPRGAISIEERPAEEFDEQAVRNHLDAGDEAKRAVPPAGGCPGTMLRRLGEASECKAPAQPGDPERGGRASMLGHWPVQLALLGEQADVWDDADVLLCADCVPFAMPDLHQRLMVGRTVAVACPKLDDTEAYVTKMANIIAKHNIKSITIARMEVPCCGGLERIVQAAMEQVRKSIPLNVAVIGTNGRIQQVNGLAVG